MNFTKYFILLFTINAIPVNAARILAVFGYTGRSHYAFVEPLLLQLAHRGHDITSITNYPQSERKHNFRDIEIKENKHLFDDFTSYTTDDIDINYYDVIHAIYNRTFIMCINILNHLLVREMMQNESFDLIISDVVFSESLFGFAEYFKAPIIGVSAFGTMMSVDDLVGNITPLSYVPDYIMLRPYSLNLNLWDRCLNVAMFVLEWMHYYYKYMPVQKKIYEHHFPSASLTFEEAQRNFSLVLINDHFTVSRSRPYVPNMIEVAGMHIPSNVGTVPWHVDKLLKEAKYGIVYVHTELLPAHIMDMLLQTFRNLAQTILWNLNTTLPSNMGLPDNVHVHSKLSHHRVLSHSNVHLLVSHGTYLNVIESIHYGVPMLRIPNINGDLDNYVDFIKKIGNGISVTPHQFNKKSLSKALHDLLDSDQYRRDAKILSQRFRDQQTSPLERAIYWVEYVLRHNGAPHMRNLGQNLNTWQFYNLDALVCLIIVILSVVCLAYKIIKIVVNIVKMSRLKKNIKYD